MRYLAYNDETGVLTSHLMYEAPTNGDSYLEVPTTDAFAYSDVDLRVSMERVFVDPILQVLVDKVSVPYALSKSSIAADGVDTAIISGVPSNISLVIYDNEGSTPYITDGEDIVILAYEIGVISLYLRSAYHLVTRIDIEAT